MCFRLWAPKHASVSVLIDDFAARKLDALEGGWHELFREVARPGSQYRFVLPDGCACRTRPRVTSRRTCTARARWSTPAPMAGATAMARPPLGGGGPLRTACRRLHAGGHVSCGDRQARPSRRPRRHRDRTDAGRRFPGRRNWGYDGVLPFAPDASYGRPEDLKALVDAAHARGLMVLLDVVYNHFGPEGDLRPRYRAGVLHRPAPDAVGRGDQLWTARSSAVREFFIHNALYWLEEFHLDGLRLDAVHAILDDSDRASPEELAERVRAAGRSATSIWSSRTRRIGRRLLHATPAAGRRPTPRSGTTTSTMCCTSPPPARIAGYYADYVGDDATARPGARRGLRLPGRGDGLSRPRRAASRVADLPPTAFVGFIQNHDQVGNRAFGERLTRIAPPEAVRAVAAIYLLAAADPDAVHGRGMGGVAALPVLLRFRPGSGRGRARTGAAPSSPGFPSSATRRRARASPIRRPRRRSWRRSSTGSERLTPAPCRLARLVSPILAVRRRRDRAAAGRRSGQRRDYAVLGDGAVAVRWPPRRRQPA